MDTFPRGRIIAAGAVGVALLLVIAVACVISLMVAECLGGDPGCYRDNDRRTVVTLALPLVAAVVLAVGVFGAIRRHRALPLALADGAMVILSIVWWSIPGWGALGLGAFAVAWAMVATLLLRAS